MLPYRLSTKISLGPARTYYSYTVSGHGVTFKETNEQISLSAHSLSGKHAIKLFLAAMQTAKAIVGLRSYGTHNTSCCLQTGKTGSVKLAIDRTAAYYRKRIPMPAERTRRQTSPQGISCAGCSRYHEKKHFLPDPQ